MFNKKFLIKNLDLFLSSCKKRNYAVNIDYFKKNNELLKKLSLEEESFNFQKNQIKSKNDNAVFIKNKLFEITAEKKKIEKNLLNWLYNQPNILLSDVPLENKIIFESNLEKKSQIFLILMFLII